MVTKAKTNLLAILFGSTMFIIQLNMKLIFKYAATHEKVVISIVININDKFFNFSDFLLSTVIRRSVVAVAHVN